MNAVENLEKTWDKVFDAIFLNNVESLRKYLLYMQEV